MQHDDLVTDLVDQNGELQAEANSPRTERAEKRNSHRCTTSVKAHRKRSSRH